MILRWSGVAAISAFALVVVEAPIALAAVSLGVFWGSLVVAAAGILLTALTLTMAPRGNTSAVIGSLRAWATNQARHPNKIIRTAYRTSHVAGFLISSVLLGPIVTSIALTLLKGPHRHIWLAVIGSSLIFAATWVGFYSGLWAIIGR